MNKARILTSDISVFNLQETCDKLLEFIQEKKKTYICVSNVHTVVMGDIDPEYAKITNSATLATADGVPLVWASKILKGPKIHGRASGPDILDIFLNDPKYANTTHFFYGSTPEVLNLIEEKLKLKHPNFKCVGLYSPPFRKTPDINSELDQSELHDVAILNKTNADIIWVGLGAPKQEIWMYRFRKHLTSPVLIGVGAAFDFISENKSRAPLWMQKNGLEWFYRLSQEPTRLFSRYLDTNPKFIFRTLSQAVRQIFNTKS